MDPNEALRKFRQAQRDFRNAEAEDYGEGDPELQRKHLIKMAEAAARMDAYGDALDNWLSAGGFKPRDWDL